jgi:pilus assembly protein CpaC
MDNRIVSRFLTSLVIVVALAAPVTPSFGQTDEESVAPRAAEPVSPRRSPPPLNQRPPPDDPERQELEVAPLDARRQKFLSLYIGIEHQESLPYIPPDARFKGDFKKVVKVSINRDQGVLLFQATQEGVATLTIHDGRDAKLYEFRVDVKKSNLTKVANEMRSLLNDIEGIAIKIVNNKVVVDGQVLLPRDLSRIISVVMQYGENQAASLVTLSPLAQKKIAQAIANDIGNPEIGVRAVNDKFILEGMAESAEERDRAEGIAQVYVPDLVKEAGEKDGTIVKLRKTFVLNFIKVKAPQPKDPGKTIQLVVHYVELNKNYQKSFRFQFTPTLEDKSTISFTNDSRQPGGMVSSLTGIVSNLLPKLNWAKTHGHARVLQSSSLIVLDGQKGDLKNVVKLPYTTINQQGQPVTQFEEAGFISSITPAILNPRSDSIRLNMDFSMKSLLGLTDKGPMVSNNSMQTVLIVRSGQSAAVGGLISNSNGTDYNKLPKGANTDPLISLYASKSFQRNQSQFVVFVTPIIKSSASQGAEKVKQKFRLRD